MVFYYGLLTCFYSFAKESFSIIYGTHKQNHLLKVSAVLCTVLVLLLGLPLVLLCMVLKFFLRIYLKVWNKGNFGSFLVEHDGPYDDLFIYMKQACQKLHNSHHKFSSVVQKCCGLCYFIKNQVTVDDVISASDEDCSTKDKLLDYLEINHFNVFDSKIKLWDVKVFKKPIQWCSDNKIYYPIVVKYNHCIADAVCLSAFQHKYLLNDMRQARFENAMKKSKRSEEVLQKSTCLRLFLDSTKMSCNFIRSHKNSIQQHLAVFVEEDSKYLELIKRLSGHLQCTFTDVVLSACAASILDFLKMQNCFPDEILVGNTCRQLSEDISAVCNANVLRNDVTIDLYKLPCVEEGNVHLKFKAWFKILNMEKRTANFQLMYIFRKMVTYTPEFVLKYTFLRTVKKASAGLTNIPGPDFGRIGSCTVKDCFIFCNHFLGTKFVMFLHSYGGRLQASLVSDKHVPITREDLQRILNNTFKKIDVMGY